MSSPSPIGVFDSGIGGLTVVKSLRRLLPNESLLYLGDTARVPYGNKTAETVTQYSLQIAQFLVSRGVKAIVVACNTSSAVALATLQKEMPVPVIGMIAPGAQAACRATRSGKIGVIGTRRTIISRAYDDALHAIAPDIAVHAAACPLFVSLVEEGWLAGDVARSVAETYLAPLKDAGVDTLILGCTHYPLLAPVIQDVMRPHVNLIDSGEAAAHTVAKILVDQNIQAPAGSRADWSFMVTDTASLFSEVAKRVMDAPVPQIHHVQL